MPSGLNIWFGSFNLPATRWRTLSPRGWTWVGGLAIPLWSTWPALSLHTRDLPPLECLAIAFAVAGFALSRLQQLDTEPASTAAPGWKSWIPAVAFALGSSGSALFFLLATHYIPAAEANLILYLWPVIVVALGAALRLFRLGPRHIVGIVLGLAGAAIVLGGNRLSLSPAGIGLALLGGISWALYCVFALKWRGPTGPLLARGFGISAILCGALHLVFEQFTIPTMGSAAAAGIIGVVPTAFGYLAWDSGFRRGDSQLLAVMAYATPLCSTLLLAALGLEPLTGALLAGAALIVAAGLLSRS